MNSRTFSLLLLAVLYTGLNACKPLHIDDTAYYWYARQISQHPFDPYGFTLLWYDEPNEANDILAPPVFPAWWALCIRLFGEVPLLWKLGLLPWCLLLTMALHALFRRFATGLEMSLTWLTMLSPALLPSLNLMLDVPALALSLSAICLFLGACDRNSIYAAMIAGLVAGVAAQTKYTGLLAPGAMLLAAATRKRWHLWPAAAVVTVSIILSWEVLTAHLYGRSHFLNSLGNSGELTSKVYLLIPLFAQLGGLLPAIALLNLSALGIRQRWQLGAIGIVLLGFSLIALVGNPFTFMMGPIHLLVGNSLQPPKDYQIAHTFFFLLGLGCAVVFGLIPRLLFKRETHACDEVLRVGETAFSSRSDSLFLILWLVLELMGYLALSPFPAARRMLGLVVVLTLLVGRLSARTLNECMQARALGEALAVGIALGLAVYGLDLREAQVEREGVENAVSWIKKQGGGHVWYVGHWGWQFYAERSGMEPVIVDYQSPRGRIPLPLPSQLREGDWLVVPDDRIYRQNIELDPNYLCEEVLLRHTDAIPFRTVWCFYSGISPIEHHQGDRLSIQIFRVKSDFTPKKGAND